MSDFRWLSLSALDTWMFRDGRPFDQSDAGAAEATSIFPPWPPTVVGAVRAALWQGLPGGKWDKSLLGDGTDWAEEGTLGPLSFTPPILLRDGKPIYPAPLHVLRGGADAMTLLRPGEAQSCDLGQARLPEPDAPLEGAKPLEGDFVTAEGMARILAGGLPEVGDIVEGGSVFSREARVGIGIDPSSRRVREGMLYLASHVRPAPDVEICIGLSGWKNSLPERLIAFGGEHRQAALAPREDVVLPGAQSPKGGRRIAVALSPIVLEALPGPGEDLAGLGNVVSACLGKPLRIGGWDSQNRRALPMRLALPAGSMWFLEDAGDHAASAAIGLGTKWGFGALALGKWEGTR